MKTILIEIKIIIKKIVTNSNMLSYIRRRITYYNDCQYYKKIYKSYIKTNYPEKISRYKDKFVGKRCFIVGNGPSLKAEDLDKIRGEFSFATNRIYLMYDKTRWRPTFYLCQDAQLLRTVNEYYETCSEEVWLSYRAKYAYGINVDNAMYYLLDTRKSTRRNGKIDFSDNVNEYVADGGTVTYSAIQLAIYMGFSQIYLLGVDHSFSHTLDKNRRVIEHKDVKKDYFDERYKDVFKIFEEKGKVFAAPDKELMDIAFREAYLRCKQKGINIYNATRGGKLEVFERVNLDKILF